MVRKFIITLAAFIGFLSIAAAQDLIVKGTVTDVSGAPLPGATVLIKGTSTGTSTGQDGRYEIMASSSAVLVVSYLGYHAQAKPVGGKSTLDFILEEDSAYLDDVLVVAYGTMSESDFTGSASQIKGDGIAQASRESLDKGMVGKIAGVRVSSDNGDPGSAGHVQIRGVGSISAATSPVGK